MKLSKKLTNHIIEGGLFMSSILKEKVQGPVAWKGIDLAKNDSWVYYLSEKTIESLENALFFVKQKGLQAPNFNKEDFPIPDLSDEISYLTSINCLNSLRKIFPVEFLGNSLENSTCLGSLYFTSLS